MSRQSGIYIIKFINSERSYIGSSIDIYRRKANHLYTLKNNKHHSAKMQRHFNKYGILDLSFEILEFVPLPENLLIREQHYLDTLKPYFNNSPTAGNSLGCKHTEESKNKRKLLKNKLGYKMTDEQKENCRIAQLRMHEERPQLKEDARLRALGNTNKRGKKLSQKQVIGMTGANHYAYYDLPNRQKNEIIKKYGPLKINPQEHRNHSGRSLALEYGASRNKIMQIINTHYKNAI